MSINTPLKNKILKIVKADQDLRKRQFRTYKKVLGTPNEQKEIKKMDKEMTSLNKKQTKELKIILKRYGWPGKSLVGQKASEAIWVLAQHSDHDAKFQKQCLKLLTKAADEGEALKKHVGFLTDRILVHQGKKQLYGTQFRGKKDGSFEPFPIARRAQLDKRRKTLEMESFKEYEKQIKKL